MHLVEGGILHPISYLAFVSRGFRFENIIILHSAEIVTYGAGAEALVANGLLLKAGSPAVYILNNGTRQLLSYFVFTQRGLDRQVIAAVTEDELTRFAVSSWLYPPADNTLIRGDQVSTVYVIESGRRRGLNLAAFQGRGYQFAQVRTLAQSEVNGYELGTEIVQ